MFGIGIIGCGFGVKHHAYTIRKEAKDYFKLVAFCDMDKEKVKRASNEYNVKPYEKVEDFLNDKDIDLVIIATRPHDTHYPLAIQCLKKGKNVVVEKPFSINLIQAYEMIEEARKRNLLITSHQNRRWDIDFLLIKEVVNSGLLGEIKIVKNFYISGHGKIDTIYEWGSHIFDQTLTLMGKIPDKVFAKISFQNEEWDKLGYVSSFLIYENGPAVETSLIPMEKLESFPRFYVSGTIGSITQQWVQRRQDSLSKHFEVKGINKIDIEENIISKFLEIPCWKIPTFYENLYQTLEGKSEIAVKKEEILRWALLTETIKESAKTGKIIDVKEFYKKNFKIEGIKIF